MSNLKEYLGDSVYCELNEYGQFRLTTENGGEPSNEIFLEPEVLESLNRFAAYAKSARARFQKEGA
jgi:hypothetical protein